MKTERHLMLDIETMSSDSEAAVVAIGARIFTLSGPAKGFEVFIDPAKACIIGNSNPETIAWWGKQGAYEQVFSGKTDPADAFHRFMMFCKEQKPDYVWANSPSFDCVIMRHMARQTGLKFPFHYRDEHDCRTLNSLGRAMGVDCKDIWTNPGRRPHMPLDDATTQAEVVIRVLNVILNSPGAYSSPGYGPLPSAHERLAASPVVTASDSGPLLVPRGSSD